MTITLSDHFGYRKLLRFTLPTIATTFFVSIADTIYRLLPLSLVKHLVLLSHFLLIIIDSCCIFSIFAHTSLF